MPRLGRITARIWVMLPQLTRSGCLPCLHMRSGSTWQSARVCDQLIPVTPRSQLPSQPTAKKTFNYSAALIARSRFGPLETGEGARRKDPGGPAIARRMYATEYNARRIAVIDWHRGVDARYAQKFRYGAHDDGIGTTGVFTLRSPLRYPITSTIATQILLYL